MESRAMPCCSRAVCIRSVPWWSMVGIAPAHGSLAAHACSCSSPCGGTAPSRLSSNQVGGRHPAASHCSSKAQARSTKRRE
eukprot:2506463-Rhodomonas_salina.1